MKQLHIIGLFIIIMMIHTHAYIGNNIHITPSDKLMFIIEYMKTCPYSASCIHEDNGFRIRYRTPYGLSVFAYEYDNEGNERIAFLITHPVFKGEAQKLFMLDEHINGCVDYASTAFPSHIFERNVPYSNFEKYHYAEEYWQHQYEQAYEMAYEFVILAQYYK